MEHTVLILKMLEWLRISDSSKVLVNTSQLGNLFSNILVAYSYHHQGIMTRKHSCIYKVMVTVNNVMAMW